MDRNKLLKSMNNILINLGIIDGSKQDENIALEELKSRINATSREMEQNRQNYDFANDDTLIDMYIYTLKAQEMKYKHLLHKLRGSDEDNLKKVT